MLNPLVGVKSGAEGYLLKESVLQDLVTAIEAVLTALIKFAVREGITPIDA